MIELHRVFFTAVVVYFAVMLLLFAVSWLRGQGPSGSALGALIIGEALLLLQSIVGLVLIAIGKRPDSALHWLYGAVLVLSVPVAYVFSAQREDRQVSLFYGLACLLIVALAVRAAMTG